MKEHKPAFHQRWNLQHRLQHGTLATSMFGLIVSGLAIKFHAAGWAQGWYKIMGGFHNNLILHKISATLLVAVSVWHLAYMLASWAKERSHPLSWAMMPTLKDGIDMWHHMLYLLNLRKEPPQYDRYTYLEKFEYLSIFWGMIVMGLTGFSLWFPATAGIFVSRTILDLFRIVHGNEAVVACIALLYGHFFTVHFNPSVFPSSSVWYNGKISLEHMLEEHPLEYKRLVEKGELPAVDGHHEHALSPWRKGLAFVELVLYSAVFYWLLISYLPKVLA
ncbi:MAG TPA: cytochrome b/b6 domain-containing protein [Symbiobacteriaceae bacterium]|nr:cytochrome b/b6 domain-containing protein [Symbiobacteriaceae bacterium]